MSDLARQDPVRFGGDRLEPLFRIGLKPLDLTQWFELDDQLEHYRAEKDRLTASEGAAVFREEPGTEQAQAEVRALIEANLRDHHPHVALPIDGGASDILEAARMVQEDLLLLRRDDSGWRLVAATLHFPSSWSLAEKFSLPLDQIHGNVPEFGPGTRNASLMARIFDGLKVEQPVQRMNWSLYPTATLHHPYSARSREANPDRHTLDAASFIRVERQTLRKLPSSGDILFTVRIYLDPLAQLAKHPGALDRLREYLLALTPAERDYKGLRASFDDVVAIIDAFRADAP
ncbi:MAG: heme-dependent oxidative N-demethylase family protein [Alphaproteobacteria bacterium]